jgi:Asp-tRNA(Asn)/Glu-tRNA(Gln) amidotransferase A subunit family amidase
MSARDYLDAQEAWARYTTIWPGFLCDYDVLLTPSMPVTAFELGRRAPSTINGVAEPASYHAWRALAQPANLAGLPAVSVSVGPGRSACPWTCRSSVLGGRTRPCCELPQQSPPA